VFHRHYGKALDLGEEKGKREPPKEIIGSFSDKARKEKSQEKKLVWLESSGSKTNCTTS